MPHQQLQQLKSAGMAALQHLWPSKAHNNINNGIINQLAAKSSGMAKAANIVKIISSASK